MGKNERETFIILEIGTNFTTIVNELIHHKSEMLDKLVDIFGKIVESDDILGIGVEKTESEGGSSVDIWVRKIERKSLK